MVAVEAGVVVEAGEEEEGVAVAEEGEEAVAEEGEEALDNYN